ncbi:efflux RND transporter periplasmic adaptor subunit [Halieaceae bacterium IMCC14734]|uniref:Efflux RND transporter periplasmic adaptor subunit n=1 Tax=Candidatus Litorirhabdus singularis TaxID=2518993 RepID=A0ABT3TLI2_9GAMM|nr:efflux RND transporter periplasmic adaptor subunit [Candidatus Litorirhabdus singularis]MCX2983186.1 efflux RND transporter periplasmic adaptor subunit [Candidatus Litorirhabdus singularis]
MRILTKTRIRQLIVVSLALALQLTALARAESILSPLDCVLEPSEVVEVSSAVEGVIEQIHVDRNDMVKKGQLLVELDDEVETTQVELAAARANLRTNIDLMETELKFNKRNEDRLAQLYATNTISLHIKDEAETDTKKSALQLKNAREAQQLARLELAKAKAILELRSMHSPIDGVIVARHKVAGEFVEDQSILRIAQLDPLVVEVIVPGERFGTIKEGMLVEVVPEHNGKQALMARVTMVDRVIDPSSGTFDVRAELENDDYSIPSGLHCTAQFTDEPYPEAAIAEVSAADASEVSEDAALLMPATQDAEQQVEAAPMMHVVDNKSCLEESASRFSVTALAEENSLSLDDLEAAVLASGYYDVVRLEGARGSRLALGVFSSEASALKMQRLMSDKGIEAEVKELPRKSATKCADGMSYAALTQVQ